MSVVPGTQPTAVFPWSDAKNKATAERREAYIEALKSLETQACTRYELGLKNLQDLIAKESLPVRVHETGKLNGFSGTAEELIRGSTPLLLTRGE